MNATPYLFNCVFSLNKHNFSLICSLVTQCSSMTTVDERMQPLIKRALQPKRLSNCLISLFQLHTVLEIALHIIAPTKETFAPYLNRKDKK